MKRRFELAGLTITFTASDHHQYITLTGNRTEIEVGRRTYGDGVNSRLYAVAHLDVNWEESKEKEK